MKSIITLLISAFLFSASLHAQVPQIINYQGRVAVGGVNFNGSGQFKFALVDATGTTVYWGNSYHFPIENMTSRFAASVY